MERLFEGRLFAFVTTLISAIDQTAIIDRQSHPHIKKANQVDCQRLPKWLIWLFSRHHDPDVIAVQSQIG